MRQLITGVILLWPTIVSSLELGDVVDGIRIEDFIDILIQVESGGNHNAIGADGELGLLQITEEYAIDAGVELRFLDREESQRAFLNYMRRYSDINLESMARIHNGGPLGYKKLSTLRYWKKVQERIKTFLTSPEKSQLF